MSNNERVVYSIATTFMIFITALFIGNKISFNNNYIPHSFISDTLILLFSSIVIYILRKSVNYKFSIPKLKNIFKPMLFSLLIAITINVSFVLVENLLGIENDVHFELKQLSILQVFIFIFIYASITEEILFRGFLMNILSPLNNKKINVFKIDLSFPIVISAFMFGLSHLILITTGASILFLVRIIVFTTVVGLIAGYYQEKYDNNAYAIIVHMSSNILALIGTSL